ncbi:hypothetical protein F5Y15DRAFT_38306 [Xylariaceae sp. FL0016]|nr:hypothetical protein F5Y15DRAFT_38306 [Xylariaceae sp. FL0016]
MPTKSHHRSRSSVDRVMDLLADLDENQMELLLQEAESARASNVPVSKGIDFFERPMSTFLPTPIPVQPAPRRKFLTSLSPRKQSSLRRRDSKRRSTQQDPPTTPTAGPRITVETAKPPTKKATRTSRSYKRISRPIFPLPTPAATQDLSEMLAAYLLEALPSSPATNSTLSSPVTPRSQIASYPAIEDDSPGIDLLEPSPARLPKTRDIFGNPMKQPTRKISGIFEVLNDGGPSVETR